jgi:hypothetical protein
MFEFIVIFKNKFDHPVVIIFVFDHLTNLPAGGIRIRSLLKNLVAVFRPGFKNRFLFIKFRFFFDSDIQLQLIQSYLFFSNKPYENLILYISYIEIFKPGNWFHIIGIHINLWIFET